MLTKDQITICRFSTNLYQFFINAKMGFQHTVRFSRKEHQRGAGPSEGMKKEGIRGESRAINIRPLLRTTHTSLISPTGASILVIPFPCIPIFHVPISYPTNRGERQQRRKKGA
jgi:hypothetical protein